MISTIWLKYDDTFFCGHPCVCLWVYVWLLVCVCVCVCVYVCKITVFAFCSNFKMLPCLSIVIGLKNANIFTRHCSRYVWWLFPKYSNQPFYRSIKNNANYKKNSLENNIVQIQMPGFIFWYSFVPLWRIKVNCYSNIIFKNITLLYTLIQPFFSSSTVWY